MNSLILFVMTHFLIYSIEPSSILASEDVASFLAFILFQFSLVWMARGRVWHLQCGQTKLYYRDNIKTSLGLNLFVFATLFLIHSSLPRWIMARWASWVSLGNIGSFVFYLGAYKPCSLSENGRFISFLGVDIATFIYLRLSLMGMILSLLSGLFLAAEALKTGWFLACLVFAFHFILDEKRWIQAFHRIGSKPSFPLFWYSMTFLPLVYWHILGSLVYFGR